MDSEIARYNMVEQQIRPWSVLDRRILDVVMAVSRENFVPEKHRNLAFADMSLPIGCNQVMMQPKVEARLVQALQPKSTEQVLEIGTGSGHMAALLANLARHVQTVEIREQLAKTARQNLDSHKIDNVDIYIGDGASRWDAGFTPDCIVISGAVPELPQSYRSIMAIGGRLVAIVGRDPIMNAILVERLSEASWDTTYLFETHLPYLDNVEVKTDFVF